MDRHVLFCISHLLSLQGKNELPVGIYQNGNQLIVNMEKIDLESEIMIYDIMGRRLFQYKLEGGTIHSLDPNMKSQLVVVCLKNRQGMICRKLMWMNK